MTATVLPPARIVLATLAVALAFLVLPPGMAGGATAPANDNYPGTEIATLPFNDFTDTTEATMEDDEPESACSGSDHSVWWSFTPVQTLTAVVVVTSQVSDFGPIVGVWTESNFPSGGLREVSCNGFPGFPGMPPEFPSQPPLTTVRLPFQANAGETYYLRVAGEPFDFFDDEFRASGPITIEVTKADAPANDIITDAVTITSIPYSHTVDLTGATADANEPSARCAEIDEFGAHIGFTAWYTVTPQQEERILVSVTPADFESPVFPVLVVWEGTPGALEPVGCSSDLFGFVGQPGQAYYVQLGSFTFDDFNPGQGGLVQMHIDRFEVPVCPPSAAAYTDPAGDVFGEAEFRPDLLGVTIASDNQTTCFTLNFESLPDPSFDTEEAVAAVLDIDVDGNANTGWPLDEPLSPECPAPNIGEEVYMFVDTITGSLVTPIVNLDIVPFGGLGPMYAVVTFGEDSVTLALPTARIGGDSSFKVSVVAGGYEGPTDCLPNGGAITSVPLVTPQFGDVNCDLRVDEHDVTNILRFTQQLEFDYALGCPALGSVLPGSYTATATLVSGDIDCSGDIGPADVLPILLAVASLPAGGGSCPNPGDSPG